MKFKELFEENIKEMYPGDYRNIKFSELPKDIQKSITPIKKDISRVVKDDTEMIDEGTIQYQVDLKKNYIIEKSQLITLTKNKYFQWIHQPNEYNTSLHFSVPK